MSAQTFAAVSYPCRLHSGDNALEHLPREVARAKSKRVFILCGRSVATRTPLIARIRSLLGETCAGAYESIRKDAPLEDVQAAVNAARACGSDMLVAVGAGAPIAWGSTPAR